MRIECPIWIKVLQGRPTQMNSRVQALTRVGAGAGSHCTHFHNCLPFILPCLLLSMGCLYPSNCHLWSAPNCLPTGGGERCLFCCCKHSRYCLLCLLFQSCLVLILAATFLDYQARPVGKRNCINLSHPFVRSKKTPTLSPLLVRKWRPRKPKAPFPGGTLLLGTHVTHCPCLRVTESAL